MQGERWYAEGGSMGMGDAHFLEVEDPSISLEAATCLLSVVGSIVVSESVRAWKASPLQSMLEFLE